MKTNKSSFLLLLLFIAFFTTGCTAKTTLKQTEDKVANVFPKATEVENKNTPENIPQENLNSAQPDTLTSIKDLLSKSSPQVCTWTDILNGKTYTGTIYISDKKFSQDIPMADLGIFHAISDGITLYSWSDKSNTGVKMLLNSQDVENAKENLEKDSQEAQNMNVDFNKDFNFKCNPWNPEPNKFNLPSNVNFVDVADFSKNLNDLMKNVDLSKFQKPGTN